MMISSTSVTQSRRHVNLLYFLGACLMGDDVFMVSPLAHDCISGCICPQHKAHGQELDPVKSLSA